MFAHEFQIIKKIGSGQFGHIFLAQLMDSNQQVVVKQIDAKHRCKEHQILSNIKHPNIIKIIDTIHEARTTSIILEYAAKGDLSSYVKKEYSHQYVPQRLIRSWLLQLCLALYYVHYQMNSIHRDVKLINVLVMQNGLIKLCDFGLAKKISADDDMGKSTAGTPYYLSPESINFGSFTIKSDVWGLGCLIYELCTGTKPFQGKAFGQIFHNIVEGFVEEFPPEAQYSKWLQNIVSLMLDKNVDKRPSIMMILDDVELRREFEYLKETYKEYDHMPYPELCIKTTKNFESEDKFGSSFKHFSQSLKTSKKEKVVRIPVSEQQAEEKEGSKKVERSKYANKSLQFFLNKRKGK